MIAGGARTMFFIFDYNPYIAIIADIKGSKSIKNRDLVQEKLKETLVQVNKKYAMDIASKFTITLGDEFQGLLLNGSNTMRILSDIEQNMYPVQLRFGLGIGQITTNINPEMAIGADGPSYYRARAAMQYLKENENKRQVAVSDTRFEVECENQGTITLINSILSLLTIIKTSWSDRQREVIWDMLKTQDSQVNVAKRFRIQQPTVQKILASGRYYAYKEALDIIDNALEEIRR